VVSWRSPGIHRQPSVGVVAQGSGALPTAFPDVADNLPYVWPASDRERRTFDDYWGDSAILLPLRDFEVNKGCGDKPVGGYWICSCCWEPSKCLCSRRCRGPN